MNSSHRAFLFHFSNYLNIDKQLQLKSIFSLRADDSSYLQQDIKEIWQKRIFEYNENIWLIYMEADLVSINEEISDVLDDDAWFLMHIGDDYTAFTDSHFQDWMQFHLSY